PSACDSAVAHSRRAAVLESPPPPPRHTPSHARCHPVGLRPASKTDEGHSSVPGGFDSRPPPPPPPPDTRNHPVGLRRASRRQGDGEHGDPPIPPVCGVTSSSRR